MHTLKTPYVITTSAGGKTTTLTVVGFDCRTSIVRGKTESCAPMFYDSTKKPVPAGVVPTTATPKQIAAARAAMDALGGGPAGESHAAHGARCEVAYVLAVYGIS